MTRDRLLDAAVALLLGIGVALTSVALTSVALLRAGERPEAQAERAGEAAREERRVAAQRCVELGGHPVQGYREVVCISRTAVVWSKELSE